jgi:hypothetical protein
MGYRETEKLLARAESDHHTNNLIDVYRRPESRLVVYFTERTLASSPERHVDLRYRNSGACRSALHGAPSTAITLDSLGLKHHVFGTRLSLNVVAKNLELSPMKACVKQHAEFRIAAPAHARLSLSFAAPKFG